MIAVPYLEYLQDVEIADKIYVVKDSNNDVELRTPYKSDAFVRAQDLYDVGEIPKIEVWKKIETIIPEDNYGKSNVSD